MPGCHGIHCTLQQLVLQVNKFPPVQRFVFLYRIGDRQGIACLDTHFLVALPIDRIDNHHAVRPTRPVNRGSGCVFQHINALDVVRRNR